MSHKKIIFMHCNSGFTLIEAMTLLFIFVVVVLTFYQTWNLGTQHILNAKLRLGATAVAGQQLEMIRSLEFDDIGTTTGIPAGGLLENQTITANTTTYNVHTLVQFIDDPTDGTSGAGTDSAPNDYKKATITVSWGTGGSSNQIASSSIFALDGVESVAAGTGVLSINVLNTAGAGVSGATVHIVNSSVSPQVDITAATDSVGNVTFPGAPESVQGYQISVSKTGYYPNMTYAPYPTSAFNPVVVHASVVAGSLTSTTLVCDQRSTLRITSKDPFGTIVPNLNFTISGGLAIGTDPSNGTTKYDFTQSSATNSSGEKTFNDRSTGPYIAEVDSGETQYRFLRLVPEEAVLSTINLNPNTTKSVDMVLAVKSFSSAIIKVTDQLSGVGISGASVRITNASLGYDETVVADTYGQAYFPKISTPLGAGMYDVEISASGYNSATDSVLISGSGLEEKTISMTIP